MPEKGPTNGTDAIIMLGVIMEGVIILNVWAQERGPHVTDVIVVVPL
jgi:hypothetical protein